MTDRIINSAQVPFVSSYKRAHAQVVARLLRGSGAGRRRVDVEVGRRTHPVLRRTTFAQTTDDRLMHCCGLWAGREISMGIVVGSGYCL